MKQQIRADLAVIGAGSGGLSVASGAAQLGLKVVLFEKGKMGGDCLNYGCVPSKALIAAANAAHRSRAGERLGIRHAQPYVDFAAVMAHVHGVIASIAPHDSVARFEGLGVKVIREVARFTGRRTVESDTACVTARRIVVATGSRPRIPPIQGLDRTPFLTNETIFELGALPAHLVIIGGGPIGLELGQAFRRLGSRVTVVEASNLLAHEEPEFAEVLIRRLKDEGLVFREGAKVTAAEPYSGGVRIELDTDGSQDTITGSHLLVATGRIANLEALDLAAAGVEHDDKGVCTSPSLRATNRAVFAVGDASGRPAFTHAANAEAALFIRNALFAAPVNADRLVIPRATYTDPELASVGLSEAKARERYGDRIRTVVCPFSDNDRARTEADTDGGLKLVATAKGKVVGVALLGPGAGDQISLWSLALSARVKLSQIASFVAPYPTRSEISKQAAGQWYAPKLFSDRTRILVSVLKHFG